MGLERYVIGLGCGLYVVTRAEENSSVIRFLLLIIYNSIFYLNKNKCLILFSVYRKDNKPELNPIKSG